MSRAVRISEPSGELMSRIRTARDAIQDQKRRALKCPYCQHNTIIVFEDTRGHVQTKCKHCGHEVVFDVLNMRKARPDPIQRLRFYGSGLGSAKR